MRIVILATLLFMLVACGTVQEEQPPVRTLSAEESFGSLNVTTTPSGAIVWIDNEAAGEAPIVITQLPVGWHNVTVRFARDTEQISQRKFIYANYNEMHISSQS